MTTLCSLVTPIVNMGLISVDMALISDQIRQEKGLQGELVKHAKNELSCPGQVQQPTLQPVELDHDAGALLQKAFRRWHALAKTRRSKDNGAHSSDTQGPHLRGRVRSLGATEGAASGRQQKAQALETEGIERTDSKTGPTQNEARETPVGPMEDLEGWLADVSLPGL